jgi:RNA polymerase sigma factor (sigma-70 family)
MRRIGWDAWRPTSRHGANGRQWMWDESADIDQVVANHRADLRRAARAAEGDADAIRTIVAELGPVVLRIARNSCYRRPGDVDDLAQEALIMCVKPQTLRSYAGHGPLPAFLQIVAQRRVIAITRTRRHRQESDPIDSTTNGWSNRVKDRAPGPAELTQNAAFAQALEEALQGESELVELIARARQQGFSDAELGKILGIPPGTVRVTWHRARRRLAARLADWSDCG